MDALFITTPPMGQHTHLMDDLPCSRADEGGYTQDTLSEMLGMTPNHLSAIERGASGISLEALQRLCRLLGVSADRIIFGTDDPEAEALALARRISDIKPEYRQQVQELLSAILNMS